MPNWYYGRVTIRGDVQRFIDWAKNDENHDTFGKTFVPLEDGWENPMMMQWGGAGFYLPYDPTWGDNEFRFSIRSRWASPIYLWRQLEIRYGVEVEEFGYEEQYLGFHKYHKGRDNWTATPDIEWFKKRYRYDYDDEDGDDDMLEYRHSVLIGENMDDAVLEWAASVRDDDAGWRAVTAINEGEDRARFFT